MGAAAAFTVLLAQHTTTAAFTAQTSDAGNTATTATTFCATPSSGLDRCPVRTRRPTGPPAAPRRRTRTATCPRARPRRATATATSASRPCPPCRAAAPSPAPPLRLYAGTSQAARDARSTARTRRGRRPPSAGRTSRPRAGTPVPLDVPGGAWAPGVPRHPARPRRCTPVANHGFLIRDAATAHVDALPDLRQLREYSDVRQPAEARPHLGLTPRAAVSSTTICSRCTRSVTRS